VKTKGHIEIVKMLYGLETTNQNRKLYTLATVRTRWSKCVPPTELLTIARKELRNIYLLQNLYVGTRLKRKSFQKEQVEKDAKQLFTTFVKTDAFNYCLLIHKRKDD
jgi:hypothetical protein